MRGPTKEELQAQLDAASVPYPPEATAKELRKLVAALPEPPTEDELHERFLETYEPIVTRLPEALEADRSAQAEADAASETERRVRATMESEGVSEDEARAIVSGA
jgi:hypothetical protein